MTFWKTLRWVGTLSFLMIVLVSWLGADRSDTSGESSDQPVRPAPIIVR